MPSTYTKLLYHIVFSTKNRLPLLGKPIRDETFRYIAGIISEKDADAIQIGGVDDHVHLLLRIPPTISVADLVRRIKSNSSKWLNETRFRVHKSGWQEGYAAFSVSQSQVLRVAEYIRDQESHHANEPFRSELSALLRKHGIEFDEAFLE
ncbi:MAG: IS200/IS605 family transposase [Planctomycetaceae bacterium]